MERRTFESPMDWEYQNTGPVDLTSPFTQVARNRTENLFNSPSKPKPQANAFASFGTPSKPPQTSFFTPQLSSRVAAPPFRNPAFTTPRKFDDMALSEASGAEDSPALTETSDFPNDTPEADRMGDTSMVATMTPSKVDKALRYNRSPRKHTPGRGEIRPIRESTRKELQVLRKRKRHNYDKDVSSVVKYWDDGASDSDMSVTSYEKHHKNDSRAQRGAGTHKGGWVSDMFGTMERFPTAPDNIYRWVQLGLNTFFVGTLVLCGFGVIQAVRSDLYNANNMARMEIMSRISECQNHYTSNECATRTLPALRPMCDQWYDCMMQDTEAVMQVKVTIKQVADILNEFTETMNYKTWGFILGIIFVTAASNVLVSWARGSPQAPQPHQPAISNTPAMMPNATPARLGARFETPRTQRYIYLEDDGTDTDASPPKLAPPLIFTPSGRRSPSKRDRSLSPVKYHRVKDY